MSVKIVCGQRTRPNFALHPTKMPPNPPPFSYHAFSHDWGLPVFLVAIQQHRANLPKYPAQITVTMSQPTITRNDILLTFLALGR